MTVLLINHSFSELKFLFDIFKILSLSTNDQNFLSYKSGFEIDYFRTQHEMTL
jgi:hypothetical protein